MTFINMQGKKREELVNEYYKLKNELNDRLISEKIGEEYTKKEREKLFEPLSKEMKKQSELAKEQNKLFREALDYKQEEKTPIPKTHEEEDFSVQNPLSWKYWKNFTNLPGGDKKFGPKIQDNGRIKLGDSYVDFDKDNIKLMNEDGNIYKDKETNEPLIYKGTEGLNELITKSNPKEYSVEDLAQYFDIVKQTKLLEDDSGSFIKSGSNKYKNILSDFRKKIYGKGINTITIPCNPNDLLERMDLLIASKQAGNTGVDDELQAILKSLYKKKIINKEQLKILS